jgi:hypothetical protein
MPIASQISKYIPRFIRLYLNGMKIFHGLLRVYMGILKNSSRDLVKIIGSVKIYRTNGDIYPYYAVYALGFDTEDCMCMTLAEAEKWATIH